MLRWMSELDRPINRIEFQLRYDIAEVHSRRCLVRLCGSNVIQLVGDLETYSRKIFPHYELTDYGRHILEKYEHVNIEDATREAFTRKDASPYTGYPSVMLPDGSIVPQGLEPKPLEQQILPHVQERLAVRNRLLQGTNKEQ